MTRLTSREARARRLEANSRACRLEANAAWFREQDRIAQVHKAHYEQAAQIDDARAVPDQPKRGEKK
jgi:hypothetical protein